jgi:hypothetical protein
VVPRTNQALVLAGTSEAVEGLTGMQMFELWRQWVEGGAFLLEAQAVMAARLARMAGGGPLATSEAQRMVWEKAFAVASSQAAAGLALASGASPAAVFEAGLRPFKTRVRANRRRLRRRL